MRTRSILLSILTLSLLPFMFACDRNKEQVPPTSKTEAGRDKAQDYPSTRTGENPNPAVGGTNSATSRTDSQTPASANPSGTGGSGDKSGH